MTPSQFEAVAIAHHALVKAGAQPHHLVLEVIPEPQTLQLPAPSTAYKPVHGGFPGVQQ